MTEYETLDLVASDSAQMANQFNIYLTVLTAYILTAYFVGKSLSRLQFIILTGLYLWACSAQIVGMQLTLHHVLELFERRALIGPESNYESTYADYTYLWLIAMGIGVLAGLLFMWNVRHPKAE